jgi:hypothetical protein
MCLFCINVKCEVHLKRSPHDHSPHAHPPQSIISHDLSSCPTLPRFHPSNGNTIHCSSTWKRWQVDVFKLREDHICHWVTITTLDDSSMIGLHIDVFFGSSYKRNTHSMFYLLLGMRKEALTLISSFTHQTWHWAPDFNVVEFPLLPCLPWPFWNIEPCQSIATVDLRDSIECDNHHLGLASDTLQKHRFGFGIKYVTKTFVLINISKSRSSWKTIATSKASSI